MAELSRTSGVTPATIKWYLREGLLPRGAATAPNQADYGPEHVRRLRLIRALLDIGGLSMARVRSIVGAIDDPEVPLDEVVRIAHAALARDEGGASLQDGSDLAASAADAFIAGRGWSVKAASPARAELAGLVRTIAHLEGRDPTGIVGGLAPYAEAIEPIAAAEVAGLPAGSPRDLVVERLVAGTVLMERALGILRRLAQESAFEVGHKDPPAGPVA